MIRIYAKPKLTAHLHIMRCIYIGACFVTDPLVWVELCRGKLSLSTKLARPLAGPAVSGYPCTHAVTTDTHWTS